MLAMLDVDQIRRSCCKATKIVCGIKSAVYCQRNEESSQGNNKKVE